MTFYTDLIPHRLKRQTYYIYLYLSALELTFTTLWSKMRKFGACLLPPCSRWRAANCTNSANSGWGILLVSGMLRGNYEV